MKTLECKCGGKIKFSIRQHEDGGKFLVCSCGNMTRIFLLIHPDDDSTVWKSGEVGESHLSVKQAVLETWSVRFTPFPPIVVKSTDFKNWVASQSAV